MAHIHLEDGAFSPEWILIWSAGAAAAIALAVVLLRKGIATPRMLAIAAMCTSVGFAAFLVEIPLFGGLHLNLTPLIGILAGPVLGSISVLMINLFGAAVGHGGWGMIGANTLVNMAEVLIGFYMYRTLSGRTSRFVSGATAATIALAVSAGLVVLIVAMSGIQDSELSKDEIVANMTLVAAADVVVGVVEGVMTGYIVTFIGRIRPDLLALAERARNGRRGQGDPQHQERAIDGGG